MDEITQRLKEACDACTKNYESWRAKTTDHVTREALMEAVHELRKVAARLEIELAVADRQQNPNDPIPIPSHRASRRSAQAPADDIGNSNDDFGNRGPRNGGSSAPRHSSAQRAPRQARPAEPENTGPSASEEAAATGKPLSLRRASASDDSQG